MALVHTVGASSVHFTLACPMLHHTLSRNSAAPIDFWGGKGLEEVYLRVFGLRKERKITQNAETAKTTIQTVFDPSFFHITLGGGPRQPGLKKKLKKTS